MERFLLSNYPLWGINLILAGFVFARAPRKATHQAFAVFVLAIVGWSFSIDMARVSATLPVGIIWGRLAFTSAGLIGSSFAIFCQVFPDLQRFGSPRMMRFFILSGVLVSVLTLTPLVLSGLSISVNGDLQARYGILYPLFSIFILLTFSHGIWTLIKTWRSSRGRNRLQTQYLLLGLSIALGGGTTTNLLIPAFAHSSHFSGYGPYFALIVVGLTAHAIIRHRLMDIQVIVRQSVTYGLSMAVMTVLLWGSVTLIAHLFTEQYRISPLVFAVLAGVAGMVVFSPLRRAFQRLLDRYCYRAAYDERLAMRQMSQVLADLLRLTPLCEYLTTFMLTTFQVEWVAIYLCQDPGQLQRRAYRSASDDIASMPASTIDNVAYLIEELTHWHEPVVRDELRWRIPDTVPGILATEWVSLQAEVMIPLVAEQRLVALMTMGEKMSGDAFFPHDLDLLVTVGHQASVALKRAQLYEEVAWMKEYNESILRQMASGVIAVSQVGVVTMMNEAASRMLEIPAAAVIGQHVLAVIPGEFSAFMLHTLKARSIYTNRELTVKGASGKSLPVVLSTSLWHGEDEDSAGAILVFTDLSRVKELEEEKRRIERLASIGAFVSGIAHEIKNPLVAIKTLAELLPEQYDDEEFRHTFMTVALREVERIDALLHRLRGLVTASPVAMQSLNPLLPLNETLALLAGELTRRHIKVVCNFQPLSCTIMGDHDQLKQVFLNLCLNSIEAIDEHGTITITATLQQPPGSQPPELHIAIADTGAGIRSEEMPHIFEPFVTLKDTGSGLGLAICRGIIDYHRGSIEAANNTNGYGATFTLKLPTLP